MKTIMLMMSFALASAHDFPIPPAAETAGLSCKVFPKLDNTSTTEMWKVQVRATYRDRAEWEQKLPWLFHERPDGLKLCFKWMKTVDREIAKRRKK